MTSWSLCSAAAARRRALQWSAALVLSCCAGPGAVGDRSALAEESAHGPLRLPPTVRQVAFEPLPHVAGATPSILSLAELEQLARDNNPTLTVARARIVAARGRQIQAGLCPNTVIGYSGMEMGDEGTAGMQGGFLSQEFVTGGKLRLDQAVAGQEIQASRSELDAQELRVLNDLRLRFYDSLVAQRRVELTGELVRIGDRFTELSRQLVRAQQLSQNDYLLAEIEVEEARVLADNARNEHREAWRRLAAVVGLPTLAEAPLAGDLTRDVPHCEWEESYTRVMRQSPELSAANARVQRARFAIQRARRENIPNVDVMVIVQHMNTTGDNVAGVQAGIPLPILNRNQGNILEAEAELIAAQNQIRRIELDLQDRLAMAFRRYANARQQADRYKNEIVPRSQQSIDLVTRGFSAGQLDFLSLLTSQRTYLRVNLAYLDALAELWQAATMIEGQLLSDSLQMP